MNLFENILNRVTVPVGKQPTQTPISTQTPIVPQKPSMTLFSDEQQMFQKMKADNLSDEQSFNLLKKRRSDLLGGNTKLAPDEQSMLLKMQADNLSAKEATAMIQKRRKDQFEKKYSEGNLLQKGAYNTLMFAAGNAETALKYGGNILDFATLGKAGFGDDVKRMEQVTQSPEFDSTARKVGSYLPDVALAVSPLGGSYLAGAKGLSNLALRSGVVGAGFGATQPILEKGSEATMGDIATGGAIGAGVGVVATPIVSKALKYGQAGYYGGFTGMGKSIARDTKAGIQAITPSGANISTRANRFNANEIREFKRMTGQSPGEFATTRGMTKTGDDAVVEATNLWQKSKEQADDALKAIKGRFKPVGEKDYLKMTIDDLDTRLTKTESPDVDRLKQLKTKYEDSGLTMSEINEVKRLYSQNHKYSFVDVGSEAALRSRNLQDGLRKWQFKVAEENGLTNLKEINKTTQGWKTFADSLGKKLVGSSGNNALSLTDAVMLSGGNPENIALYLGRKLASSDTVKRGAIKLFSKQTKPSIIKASIGDIQNSNFQKNVNRGISGVGNNSGGKSLVRPVGLLPAPSGKATGAKNVRVNQPTEKQTGVKERVNKEKVKRPGTASRQEASIEKKLVEARERENMLKNVKNDITSATKAARYGGTGNTRVEAVIDAKLAKGEITQQEALSILDDVKTNPRYEYIDQKALDKYIEKIKGGKVESFDELIAPKPQPKEIVTKTHKQIYDKLNQMANDGRYGDKSWNDLADEFKKVTGKDIMDTSFDDFGPDGMLKLPKKVVAPKKIENTPIVKKEATKVNKDIFDEETRDAIFVLQPKGYNVPKNADIYPSESGIGVSYKGKGRVNFYISTKDGKIKVSTDGLGANQIDFIQDAWKKVGKDIESMYVNKSPSPKPIVKNLQKTEKSATIGDMETKKLIEEARKYKSGRDMYNTLDYDNRSKFDKIGVYSLKHFEDFYKKNITNTKGEIVMYRGQSKPGKQVQFNDTKFQGNTDGGVFFTTNKDIARKYGENIIELKSNKNNTLSYKEAEKLQKMAEKIVEKDIRNGIQSKPIIEQMALGRPKAFAEYTKKPFLETGDMFGEQGEMIYYKGFDNK